MKYIIALGALLASIVGANVGPFATPASAQTAVQQVPTRLDAATNVCFAQLAVNNTSICTIVVPAGQFAYVTGISIDTCQNGTATINTNVNYTTTNLPSTPKFPVSLAATANLCGTSIRYFPSTPLKSLAAGTSVVVTGPAAAANTQQTIRVYYYLAP